jgi:N-acetylneuraminate synthase
MDIKNIQYEKAIVAAEIGSVHGGSLEKAKELANLARIAGAQVLKLQKRCPKECVPKELWEQPHENKIFAHGNTYLEHRENLELDQGEHYELKTYCESIGIQYAVSVFDIASVKEMIQINPSYIKIPSCCNTHWKMIDILLNEYHGDIHISLGMTNQDDRDEIARYLSPCRERIVAYLCTSQYPTPFERLHLLEIIKMQEIYDRIGFSNHGFGISCDIAAFVLHAVYIERHFIEDRTASYTDAALSLEPDGLRRLCRDLKAVYKSLTYKPYDINEEEEKQKKKLRYYEK